MKRAVVLAFLALPGAAAADQVLLKGGGCITGIVVEQTESSITMEVGPGRISLAMARVDRVVQGAAPLVLYRQRAQRLGAGDVPGWIELGRWAQQNDLLTQAREAFEHVLAIDPQNAVAQRALGNVLLGDRWLSPEESFRARGYVLFDGQWVTPQEHEALVRERSEAAAAERARAEADARAREADARARAAEADARRAETSEGSSGIPIYGGFPVVFGRSRIHSRHPIPTSSPPATSPLAPRPARAGWRDAP